MEKNVSLQLPQAAEQLQRQALSWEHQPLMSYFKAPVSNVKPLKDLSLEQVCTLIGTDFLKPLTEKVHSGEALKSKALPYVTPCGTFKRRHVGQMLSYSGLMVIDIDCCDPDCKKELALDPFLKPVLVFISPSTVGLKLFIKVNNASVENHLDYFNAIGWYILKEHQLIIDKSGSDLPRACFLCYDPWVYYSPEGSVESSALLEIARHIPPEKLYRKGNKVSFRVVHELSMRYDHPPVQRGSKVSKFQSSNAYAAVETLTGERSKVSKFQSSNLAAETLKPCNLETFAEKPSDKLNRLPTVHSRAESALKAEGWVQNGVLWTRPGKTGGNSAIYNFSDEKGIYFMTNFSSNAPHFKLKGYTDVQVICELEYGGNFRQCIADLAGRYLDN